MIIGLTWIAIFAKIKKMHLNKYYDKWNLTITATRPLITSNYGRRTIWKKY